MREQIEQQLEVAEKAHQVNAAAYKAALAARDEASAAVREACDQASASANEVAALKRALSAFPAAANE